MQTAAYISTAIATGLTLYMVYQKVTEPERYITKTTDTFRGKCVWVTGASSGIGKAIAIELFLAGAQVCLSARDEIALQAVIDTDFASCRRSNSVDPFIVKLDVAAAAHDDQIGKNAIETILQKSISGKIDAIIHNAGISVRGPTVTMQTKVDKQVFDVNVFGPIALTRAATDANALSRGSSIVLISSIQAKLPLAYRGAYTASKHAAQAYFDSLRLELEPQDIHITTILPGYVSTNLSKNALQGDGSKYNHLDTTTAQGVSPQYVAKKTLLAIVNREKEVWLAPTMHKFAAMMYNVSPSLIQKFLRSKAKKEAIIFESVSSK